MIQPILAGIETEYGLLVEGRGASDQIEDAMAVVRSYPGPCFVGWDYRHESPRADLRGFRLDRLAIDPVDAVFDAGKHHGSAEDVRSDRILPNGARFYNDHGHPEYSTPECWLLTELARHDAAGQGVVLSAAKAYAEASGQNVSVYKNNTDFHGASYGTHESFLVPRSLGFGVLYQAVMPILVVRQILSGAGKVGVESGSHVPYQLSQRADFFVEPANAETLYRRPVFNTRDEPHADPEAWVRLHVISGDANMIASCTRRKVGLVKLALHLAQEGTAPKWNISQPPRAAQQISRDSTYQFRVELDGRNWTTGDEILESYFAAAEATLDLSDEMIYLIAECRDLQASLRQDFSKFARHVDWAAKKQMLEQVSADREDPVLQAYDLEYHNVDPAEGLHAALVDMGAVEPEGDVTGALASVSEPNRAYARGLAINNFQADLVTACWRSLTFRVGDRVKEIELPPDLTYPTQLAEAKDVGTFINMLEELRCPTATD